MSEGHQAKASNASKYPSLDGLRGIAALAVVSIHYSPYLAPLVFPSAYLAVDLFFLMSGIVISHAYERRFLAGMSASSFMVARLIRLYPMYLLGSLVAAAPIAVALIVGTNLVWTPQTLSLATAAAIAMVPIPPILGKLPALYVLNFPAWSLFSEILSNAVFGFFFKALKGRAIYLVILAGGLGVAIAAFAYGSLSGGWLWSDAPAGLVRVTYSFFLGVAVHRLHRSGSLPHLKVPVWLILLVCLVLFAQNPSAALRPIYDLACVLVAFPVIVILALSNQPRVGVGVFTFLGAISYPIYAIHVPVQTVINGLMSKLIGEDPARYAPWIGLVLTAALILASWILARTYDVWARGLLTRMTATTKFRAAWAFAAGRPR